MRSALLLDTLNINVLLQLLFCMNIHGSWGQTLVVEIESDGGTVLPRRLMRHDTPQGASENNKTNMLSYKIFDAAATHHDHHASSRDTYDQAFVINRIGDTERLERFDSSARLAGVKAMRFPAVDKNNFDLSALLKDGEITPQVMERMNKHADVRGTYGCALSHTRLWTHVASQPAATSVLIFEDDAVIPPDFHSRLKQALDSAPSDWDMLYLNHNKLVGTKVNELWLKPKNNPGGGKNALLNAYLLNPDGAKRILAFMQPYSSFRATDDILRHHFNDFNAYFLIPVLVPQSGTHSVRVEKAVVPSEICNGSKDVMLDRNGTITRISKPARLLYESDPDLALYFCCGHAKLCDWMPEFGDHAPKLFHVGRSQ